MEKATKSSVNIFACISKTSSIISFSKPTCQPEKRLLENHSKFSGKGFSGPIISIIPKEARSKAKDSSFHKIEPTSPKVSCMGQIKNKKKKIIDERCRKDKPEKKAFRFKKLFGNDRKVEERKCGWEELPPEVAAEPPTLGQMKRFSSRREGFANLDWKNPGIVSDRHRFYLSDQEMDYEDEEDAAIPFSCPITIGGGEIRLEKRKEVNLWKRRTMAPPRSLDLNSVLK